LATFIPQQKLAFLPNLLSLQKHNDVALLSAPTIITVGRLVEQKGLDILLRAWSVAVPSLPGWRLAMVGDGPLRPELQALARQLGVEACTDWLGHLDDPVPLMRACEFFVMTSHFEGTPNALLEAMACGLPAVVTDSSPGPKELVGPHESAGLIVPAGDVEATATSIVRLAREDMLRVKCGRIARRRANEYAVNRAIEVWCSLLAAE
jgi:glycosyltransferase involved in cell wall biosynthesis